MENHIDDDEDFELEAAPFESLDCTSNYVRDCLVLLKRCSMPLNPIFILLILLYFEYMKQ